MNKRFHKEKVGNIEVKGTTLELLEQLESHSIPKPYPEDKCQFYQVDGHDILLGAKAEFFHPKVLEVALVVLDLLSLYPSVSARARILTKQDITEHLDAIPRDMMVGASITTTSPQTSKAVQPGAALPYKLVDMLFEANGMGFKTWVVFEPFFKPMYVTNMVRSKLPFVNEVWVGRLNSGRDIKIPEPKVLTETRNTLADMENIKYRIWPKRKTVGDFAMPDERIIKDFLELKKWASTQQPEMKVFAKREIMRIMKRTKNVRSC